MPPRKRKDENSTLPPNLYTNKVGERTYFYFEHPVYHDRHQLGTDRAVAIDAVIAINRALGGIARQPKVEGLTVSSIIDEHRPRRLEKLGSGSAKKRAKNALERFAKAIGTKSIRTITTRQISNYLDQIPLTHRSKHRNEIIRLFDYALARGYLPHNYGNPAKVTEFQGSPPAQRRRLGYVHYKAIYDGAPVWLQLLLDIMLHTTLRPGDALRLRLDQYRDGALYTQVRKTGKFLRIELDQAEQQIIRRARSTGIASPYIVHRMPERKSRLRIAAEREHPTQIMLDQASREFSRIRDELSICADLPANRRPSLYEVRSLASWLYEQAGRDRSEVAALMAHTSEQMTAHYQDSGRVNYVTVRAGLSLPNLGNTVLDHTIIV